MVEKWIGIKEIAEHLGISVVTIYRWVENGKIPCHRVGKLWKFKPSEVDAWVSSGQASGTSKTKKKKKKKALNNYFTLKPSPIISSLRISSILSAA
jgi:excisionase family DNA binding protein